MIKRLAAKAMGLYTREDVELIVLQRYRELERVKKDESQKTFKRLAEKIEYLLTARNLANYHFWGVFPLLTKHADFLWAIAKIPRTTPSAFCSLYIKGGEIAAINPAYLSALKERIAVLFFDVKGSDVHIVDMQVQFGMRRRRIGSFLLRLLECLAVNFSANRIVGELSPVDLPNRHTQIAFYSKNGYTVFFSSQAEESGWIEKKLNPSHDRNS